MNAIKRWIAHYERLLDGSLSASERSQAEDELAFWREQDASPPPRRDPRLPVQPDAIGIWMFHARGGIFVRTA